MISCYIVRSIGIKGKMSRIFFSWLAIVICCIATSCETEVKIDIDDIDTHLVTNSLINPDSLIRVEVSLSRDVFNDLEYNKTPPVDVFIYEESELIEKLISEEANIYSSSSFKPKSNVNYELIIDSPWGQSKAKSTVPEKLVPDSTWIVRNSGRTEYNVVYNQLAIQFQDDDQEKNYYSVFLSFEYLDSLHAFGYLTGRSTLFSYDPVVNHEINYSQADNMNRQIVFSDELFDEQSHVLRLNFYNILTSADPHKFLIYMHFNTISKEYYRYLKTLELYKRQRNSNIWEDVSEPVSIYSNFSKSYGIFGAYCTHIDTILSVE